MFLALRLQGHFGVCSEIHVFPPSSYRLKALTSSLKFIPDHFTRVDAQLDAGSCVAAATRCLESIVRRFGGFIRDTLAAPVAAGRVDLAREDRIARCREAHRVS